MSILIEIDLTNLVKIWRESISFSNTTMKDLKRKRNDTCNLPDKSNYCNLVLWRNYNEKG